MTNAAACSYQCAAKIFPFGAQFQVMCNASNYYCRTNGPCKERINMFHNWERRKFSFLHFE